MSRHLLLAALAFGSATASAQNTATWDITITSSNGGADSLISWSYTGTPTIIHSEDESWRSSVYLSIVWGGGVFVNSYSSTTGSANSYISSNLDYPYLEKRRGINTGLFLTNTTTNVTGAITGFSSGGWTNQFRLELADGAEIEAFNGQRLVLSGPTSGSFLSGVAFSNFNEGQWTANVPLYSNFDPVLTVSGAPIPEPSTYGLILGVLALAGAAMRRRKKA